MILRVQFILYFKSMKFKIKKLLSPKQLWKAKYSVVMAVLIVAAQYSYSAWVNAEDRDLTADELVYNGETFDSGKIKEFERGRIVFYSTNVEVCDR